MSKETLQPSTQEISVIRLKGDPYQKDLDGQAIDCTDTLETLAQNTQYEADLPRRIQQVEEYLVSLFEGGYYGVDAKLKKGEALSFAEAFSLMTFVSMGVNSAVYRQLAPRVKIGALDRDTVFYQSIALLSSMSAKEAFVGLTPDEIAGLTAATLHLDTIVRVPAERSVFGLGGMGGDKGYPRNGENSKLFSVSTLAAISLANFGFVHKHHSYPNTSRVAGQSAIEAFGARSDQDSLEEFVSLQQQTGLLMTSCHTTRLIHTLSHRLKGETINHIVGPLSLPISAETPVHAMIGVNDNVHPEAIIKALIILSEKGFQSYANSVAFCGLNGGKPEDLLTPHTNYPNNSFKENVAIDEVAPPPHVTLAAFLVNGHNRGTFLIRPEDFLDPETSQNLHFGNLLVPNTSESIIKANYEAISATDPIKSAYVAMTVALGLFAKEYSAQSDAFDLNTRSVNRKYLRHAFKIALESLVNGKAYAKLKQYVAASQSLRQGFPA